MVSWNCLLRLEGILTWTSHKSLILELEHTKLANRHKERQANIYARAVTWIKRKHKGSHYNPKGVHQHKQHIQIEFCQAMDRSVNALATKNLHQKRDTGSLPPNSDGFDLEIELRVDKSTTYKRNKER